MSFIIKTLLIPFNLWEIRGPFWDNRFLQFLNLFLFDFPFSAAFCHSLSSLPCLLFLILLHLFLLADLLSVSFCCHLSILYSKIPQRRPANCLVTMQNRASHWVEMKTDGCLWLCCPTLTQPGMASYRSLWSKAWQPVPKVLWSHVSKTASVASDPNTVDARQAPTPLQCGHLFVLNVDAQCGASSLWSIS